MKLPIYQFFGSEDSLDVDVVFFIEEMPATLLEKLQLSKKCSQSLETFFPEKEINGNLAVFKNGNLVEVYKGTTDELNNALFTTYDHHKQAYDNQVSHLLQRDVDLKFLRSTRMILSFLSKTSYRTIIKQALKATIIEKAKVLEVIDLNTFSATEKTDSKAVLKAIAFQLGQSIALSEGQELYTKSEIGSYLPDLRKYLYREENVDLEPLQKVLLLFIALLKNRITTMKNLSEYKYEELHKVNHAK